VEGGEGHAAGHAEQPQVPGGDGAEQQRQADEVDALDDRPGPPHLHDRGQLTDARQRRLEIHLQGNHVQVRSTVRRVHV
jgi:hypothetical protein